MKLLLYCTKAKPYLYKTLLHHKYLCFDNKKDYALNGKIVAECDFEVEEIEFEYTFHKGYSDVSFRTKQLQENELFNKSCLRYFEMTNYFKRRWIMEEKGKCGYAIHIKNLHIFDEPNELDWYYNSQLNTMSKAPQNMCFVYERVDENEIDRRVLISIQPQWLCKILNGEKIIEVRKKVLKEMLK